MNYIDVFAWYSLLKIVVLIILAFWIFTSIKKIMQTSSKRKIKKETNILLGKITLFILIFLLLFSFFGPGKRTQSSPVQTDGKHQQIMKQKPMPSEEEIKKDIKNKRSKYLKAQDSISSPQEDQKEFERILKKYKKDN